jgi:metal-responsive CopG/Arc/MetJ family transcriptional regulator
LSLIHRFVNHTACLESTVVLGTRKILKKVKTYT